MASAPKVYIDNNDKIYYSDRYEFDTVSQGSAQLSASLEDIASIPGQSTWIINKVHYSVHCYTDLDGYVNGTPNGNILLGVIPYDDAGVYNQFDDYQDVRGWPFLGTWKQWSIAKLTDSGGAPVSSLDPLSRAAVSGTYVPKSPLALNRMQKINFNFYNTGTVDVYGFMSIFVSARRGE